MGTHRHGQGGGGICPPLEKLKSVIAKKNVSEVSLNGGGAAFPYNIPYSILFNTDYFHFCIL